MYAMMRECEKRSSISPWNLERCAAELSRGSNKFPTVCTFSVWHSISRDGHPVFRPRDDDEMNAGPFPRCRRCVLRTIRYFVRRTSRTIGSRSSGSPGLRRSGIMQRFPDVTCGNHFYSRNCTMRSPVTSRFASSWHKFTFKRQRIALRL